MSRRGRRSGPHGNPGRGGSDGRSDERTPPKTLRPAPSETSGHQMKSSSSEGANSNSSSSGEALLTGGSSCSSSMAKRIDSAADQLRLEVPCWDRQGWRIWAWPRPRINGFIARHEILPGVRFHPLPSGAAGGCLRVHLSRTKDIADPAGEPVSGRI